MTYTYSARVEILPPLPQPPVAQRRWRGEPVLIDAPDFEVVYLLTRRRSAPGRSRGEVMPASPR